jgi:hypothetical protein
MDRSNAVTMGAPTVAVNPCGANQGALKIV